MLPTAGTYNDTTYAGPWSIALNADAGVTITGFSDVPVETSGTLTTAFGSWSVGFGAWAVQADGSVTGYSNTGSDTSGMTDLADNANATQWTMQFTTGATVPEDIILNLVNGSSEGYQLHWQAGDNNLVLYQCSFSGYGCTAQGSVSDNIAVKQAATTTYQLVLSFGITGGGTWTVDLENSSGSILTSFQWNNSTYSGPWTPSLIMGPGITLSHYSQ